MLKHLWKHGATKNPSAILRISLSVSTDNLFPFASKGSRGSCSFPFCSVWLRECEIKYEGSGCRQFSLNGIKYDPQLLDQESAAVK